MKQLHHRFVRLSKELHHLQIVLSRRIRSFKSLLQCLGCANFHLTDGTGRIGFSDKFLRGMWHSSKYGHWIEIVRGLASFLVSLGLKAISYAETVPIFYSSQELTKISCWYLYWLKSQMMVKCMQWSVDLSSSNLSIILLSKAGTSLRTGTALSAESYKFIAS